MNEKISFSYPFQCKVRSNGHYDNYYDIKNVIVDIFGDGSHAISCPVISKEGVCLFSSDSREDKTTCSLLVSVRLPGSSQ